MLMTITILNDCVELPHVELNNPNGFTKGYYLSKCKEELLFQLPLLQSKQGVIKNPISDYLDLIVNENFLVKKLISHLEEKTKDEIRKRQNIWFSNKLLDDDINYYFLDSIKNNLLRVDVPENLYVFDKDQEKQHMDDIKQKEIICILEFVGLIFSTTSFKLHFSLKQVMVFQSKYENCIVDTQQQESEQQESEQQESEQQESEQQESDQQESEQQESEQQESEQQESEQQESEQQESEQQETDQQEDLENNDIVVLNINDNENLETKHLENNEDEDNSDSEEMSDDALSEVAIEDLVKDDNHFMELAKPNDIYKKNYYETYERAKAAKQYAIKTFLEAKKIKQLHLLTDLESSDEEDLNFD